MFQRADEATSYSQFGQDRLIADLLNHRKGGTFLDIGAFDGETYSNSLLFERHYGWQGICVEPLPEAFDNLKKIRKCISVNAAAGEAIGKLQFEALSGYGAMLSGATSSRPAAHGARISNEQQSHGFERRMIEVDVVRAADLLRQHGMQTVDFVSIDVEGAELKCLKGLLDPDIVVRTLSIENNYGDAEVVNYLAERGYVRLTLAGEDDVYRLRRECGAKDYGLMIMTAPCRWLRDRKRRRNANNALRTVSAQESAA